MRALGIDFGLKRLGLAVSDASGTLARPLAVESVAGRDAAAVVSRVVAALAARDEAVGTLVIGLPRRLDGTPHDLTAAVEVFAARVGARLGLPVVLVDERLTSHEADKRLAVRYRDWRDRQARLDAAAAAIILQDYLDGRRQALGVDAGEDEAR